MGIDIYVKGIRKPTEEERKAFTSHNSNYGTKNEEANALINKGISPHSPDYDSPIWDGEYVEEWIDCANASGGYIELDSEKMKKFEKLYVKTD